MLFQAIAIFRLSRLKFISCTYKIIAFSVECCLRYFIKRAGKTPVFERPINVSNDKRSELRFFSKSLLSNKNCLAYNKLCVFFAVYKKYTRSFPNERWHKLWLKIEVTCFSNTRFTCKIIFDISKQAKFVSLPRQLGAVLAVLAAVSHRSSRRRRQWKRLLLKVPVVKWRQHANLLFRWSLEYASGVYKCAREHSGQTFVHVRAIEK